MCPSRRSKHSPGRLEVLEFFCYGCPLCSELHPLVSEWSAALLGDVVFKRIPVSLNRPAWASLARLRYALEATGDLPKLDGAVFNALRKRRSALYDDKSIIQWVTTQGVDARKFTEASNSFGVISKAKRADALGQAYRIQCILALSVDGKYLVVGAASKGFAELVTLTDQVIGKARSERGKK